MFTESNTQASGQECPRKDDEGEEGVEVPRLPASKGMVLKERSGRGLEYVTDYSSQTSHDHGNVEVGRYLREGGFNDGGHNGDQQESSPHAADAGDDAREKGGGRDQKFLFVVQSAKGSSGAGRGAADEMDHGGQDEQSQEGFCGLEG